MKILRLAMIAWLGLWLAAGTARAQAYIVTPDTGQRLCTWDGAYISSYQTNQRVRRFDGQYLLAYDTNKRLLEIRGSVPIALITALALGLL